MKGIELESRTANCEWRRFEVVDPLLILTGAKKPSTGWVKICDPSTGYYSNPTVKTPDYVSDEDSKLGSEGWEFKDL